MDLNRLKLFFKSNGYILCLSALFFVLYTFNLDKYPIIWSDEAFFSNPAFNLAFHGFLGTTMMPTFYNISHYTYWQMPFYMVLLSVSFKLFGFGIIQARMVSVILGFFTVIFTYLLGKELYNEKVGFLAILLLILNPFFFFIARDARMDIAVICFTLISLYFLIRALNTKICYYYFGVGLFAMLSILSHPNGLFGVICGVLIYCMCKINFKTHEVNFKLKEILYMIIGPILLLIPYLWYISLDYPDFVLQVSSNLLSSAGGPLNNLFSEVFRYELLNEFLLNIYWLLNPIMILILVYLIGLGIYYIIKTKKEFNSKFLGIILLIQLFLIAVLVDQKLTIYYLGVILPYLCILFAVLFKRRYIFKKSIQRFITYLIIFLIIFSSLGIFNILYTHRINDSDNFILEFPNYIPEGSIVTGRPVNWWYLHDNYIFYEDSPLDPSKFNHLHVDIALNFSYYKKEGVQYILCDPSYSRYNSSYNNDFLKNNCTFIGEIPYYKGIPLSPIKIYKII